MASYDARVPLLSPEDVPEEYRELVEEGELNLFRAMAHTPRAMRAYRRFGTSLWHAGDLSARERELVILAVARQQRAPYEWHHHAEMGLEAGISRNEIQDVARADYCSFSIRERAIMRYACAVAAGSATEPVFEAALEATDAATVVAVTLLAGHYVLTDRVLDALSVPFDEEFVGWRLERE